MRRNKPLRRSPLKAKPSCTHPGCAGSTICRRTDKPLKRSRLNPYNRSRRARRFEEGFESEERVAWYRHQFCAVPGCPTGPCEVAHVKSRAAGGTADDAVPLCSPHHREQHDIGIRTFEGKYGLDLETMAEHYAQLWNRWGGA